MPSPHRPVVILRPIHEDEDGEEGSSPARDLQDAIARFVAEQSREESDHSERWTQRQRLAFMVGSAVAMWTVTIAGIAIATNLLG
jgi:hypothetical protein